jgi:hypothetical protein
MAPRWLDSADKHSVPRPDQVYVLLHASYVAELTDEQTPSGRIMLFIGPQHAQTDREIEILVHEYPGTGREAVIFHAMELGPKYRRYREEHPNG